MDEQTNTTVSNCLNCEQAIKATDKFCLHCGQKNRDGKITFNEMMRVFVDSVFTTDSRLFLTLKALFRPGKLTNEFLSGKQRKYLHPVRLFLISAILFFALFNLTDPQISFKNMSIGGVANDIYERSKNSVFSTEIDTTCAKIAAYYQDEIAQLALDSLKNVMDKRHSLNWESSLQLFGMHLSVSDKVPTKESKAGFIYLNPDDIINKSVEEIIKEKNITNLRDKVALKQFFKLTRESSSLDTYILGNLSLMILFMMPILALILKLVYIRRKRLYIEHLVFSFHSHSFAFILLAIALLLHQLLNMTVYIFPIALVLVYIYLYFALRKVYAQGWGKTFLKFAFLNFAYLIVFIMAFAMTIGLSFYLF